jgi:magnesium-protoporphyrin IX monomethyl ester (oxidative) cyclase
MKESMQVTSSIPIGLLYIAAVLDKGGYDVKILDTLAVARVVAIGDNRYWGLSKKEIEEEIKKINPDVVGISIQFTTQAENAIMVSRIVKKINPKIGVIVGGPDVTVRASTLLRENNSIDICVVGEGEYVTLDLANTIAKKGSLRKVKGIAFRDKGRIVFTGFHEFITDLDELPLPAYHLAPMNDYLSGKYRKGGRGDGKNLREISVITSRGCPFNCIFCSIHLHMGRRWRAHSPEYVLRHIELLVKKYGVQHIHFEDDNMTLDKKRFEKILDGVIEKGLNFSWDTPNGIRADTLDDNIVAKMKKTHCSSLMIGVESGDQKILDNIVDKSLNLNSVVNAARLCRKYGIPLNGSYVIGFPGETKQNIMNTINFALMLKREYNMNGEFLIATPLYNTRLYDVCKKEKLLTRELMPDDLSKCTQGRGIIKTKEFTPEEISELRLYATKKMAEVKMTGYIRHPLQTLGYLIKNPERIIPFFRKLGARLG